jgi:hypothetical protein
MLAKCGSCGSKHDTIIEYRNCAGVVAEAEVAADVMDRMEGVDRAVNPPSDRQVAYVHDLLSQHEWPDQITEQDLRAMERRQVSRLIERIKGSPKKATQADTLPDVPAGRYAILSTHPNPDDNSESAAYDFYQVDKPTEGRWAGRVFVSQLFGAPGTYHKERITSARAKKVLAKIGSNPEKASLAYGRESGVCGICSSPLTNKASLDAGIGPICASKTGWGL